MCALPPVEHSGWVGGGCAVTSSCPHTPHAVVTSLAVKVTECPFSLSFSCFCVYCGLCGVLFLLSWPSEKLFLLPDTTQVLLFRETFARPRPCLGLDPVGQHWVYFLSVPLLWMSRARHCPSSSLYIPVLSNSASHRDIFLNEWMRYVYWVVNLQVFKVIFFFLDHLNLILFPLTWFSHLLLGTLDMKTGYFWKCCSNTFPSFLPTVCFLLGH